jgi:dipeptidyl-peptidase 4
MSFNRCLRTIVALSPFLVLPAALAQGSLEDYQRAEQFLPGNVRHLVYVADVTPHWIEKTNRFWYRKVGLNETGFVLVDAEKNTSGPAFDHERLATALSQAAKREYSASALPFSEIEFADSGKAVRFSVEGAQWTCPLATLVQR